MVNMTQIIQFNSALISLRQNLMYLSFILLCACTPGQKTNDQKADEKQGLHADGGTWGFKSSTATKDSVFVLLIGDSILKGYYQNVSDGLENMAGVDQWVTPLHLNSEPLMERLIENITRREYAVIHFNIGLHGWQEGRIPKGQYVPLMTKYVETIKKHAPEASIVWASTTPVTEMDVAQLNTEINPIIVARNKLAADVMNEKGVVINDLYGLLYDKLHLARLDRFHWNGEGYQLMADQIVNVVLNELDKTDK